MAVRRLHPEQPPSFAFTDENLAWARQVMGHYPPGKQAAAVLPVLWRAQEQNGGWVSEPALRVVADLLAMPYIRAYEVATFYTMFQLAPVGRKAHIQVCGTTPCMLRGSEDLVDVLKRRVAQAPHTLSEDGDFSWEEVECLGSCANAPLVQIGRDTYEDLDAHGLRKILDLVSRDRPLTPGSQTARRASCPAGGLTSLTDPKLYDGSCVGAWRKRFPELAEEKTPEPLRLVEQTANDRTSRLEPPLPLVATPSPEAYQPPLLATPRGGKADDLELIIGVGSRIAALLNRLGVFHFDQIACWNDRDLAWMDRQIPNFQGRAKREQWIEQARQLAGGGSPVSSSYDKD